MYPVPVRRDGGSAATLGSSAADLDPMPVEHQESAKAARPRTHLQSGIGKAKTYTDGTVRYGFFTSSGEPQCLEEALGNKDWKEAMDNEYMALVKNKT